MPDEKLSLSRPEAGAKPALAEITAGPYQKASEPKKGITTFYSFKGGVGRSQALWSVGHLLAWRRRRVLLVDVDLEAPGLSLGMLDDEQRASRDGFLEIASDLALMLLNAAARDKPLPEGFPGHLAERVTASIHELDPQPPEESLARRLVERFPDSPLAARKPCLSLLSSGRVYEDYPAAISRLRLGELFGYTLEGERAGPLLESAGLGGLAQPPTNLGQLFVHLLRQALLAARTPQGGELQYVLVDSRAGLADIGGLCVRGLADHLVVVCGLNKQNLDGTRMVLDKLPQGRRTPEHVTLVLSPVPEGEMDLLTERLKRAAEVLERPERSLLLLHYHPRLALREEAFVQPIHQLTRLAEDYARLCARLQDAYEDTAQSWIVRALPLRSDASDEQVRGATHALLEAACLSQEKTIPLLESFARLLRGTGDLAPAWLDVLRLGAVLAPESLGAWGELGNRLRAAGQAALDAGDPGSAVRLGDEALRAYEQALKLEDDSARSLGATGVAASLLGNAYVASGDPQAARERWQEACDCYQRAVEARPRFHEAWYSWGSTLDDLARLEAEAGNTQAARQRWQDACERYQHAVGVKPDYDEAWHNWGLALTGLARLEVEVGNVQAARQCWREACECYQHAVEVRPDKHEAWSNWSAGLLDLWRHTPHRVLLEQARDHALRAEQLHAGAGAYNVACAESLLGNTGAALKWLEKAISGTPSEAAMARSDADLDPIRDHPRFRELTHTPGEAPTTES